LACASCHQQAFAFSDPLITSLGLNGENTGRHSMRLINSRFANEVKFFWDERAVSLEDQVTQPIQDHVEMGFSGTDGAPDFDDLLLKLSAIDYYQTLFEFAFGDALIDEDRIQKALAQFVRSIQSFDAKFDNGFVQVPNVNNPFPNYTSEENLGKQLFLAPPNNGGAGCAGCHAPPEFDIDSNTLNNGIIGVAGAISEIDLLNTRSPSLRDIVNPDGGLNGPLMHDGSLTTLIEVINHYNEIPDNPANTTLDNRLKPGGNTQMLNLSTAEKEAIVAFLETLTGIDVYTNEKWSNPFDSSGDITLTGGILSTQKEIFGKEINVYPNPIKNDLNITLEKGKYTVSIFNITGKEVFKKAIDGLEIFNLSFLNKGIYLLKVEDLVTHKTFSKKFVKE
jgi:cytochrome c peroxidase